MDKFKDTYRIASTRASWWDYGSSAAYFITICTDHRKPCLGRVVETRFIASPPGEIVQTCWNAIPRQFPYVQLGAFVVMPNHIHGIVIIDKPVTAAALVPPTEPLTGGGFAGDTNPMLHENVARIIRWYKGRCTYEIRKLPADFRWQARYYDHVIRDASSYQRIQAYIEDNVIHWAKDKFYQPEP